MEREKNLIPINQNIALAIEKIFKKNKRVLNAEDHCRTTFSSRKRPSYKVSLEYFRNEPGECDGGSSYLPSSFRLPSYSLFEFTHDEGIEVTSLYGTLSSIVIDETARIFEIQNCYFFNKFGEGLKIEEIGLLSNKNFSLWRNLRELCGEQNPQKVNFALSEEDSRSVNLTQDDYEKVILLVDAINEKRGFILAS